MLKQLSPEQVSGDELAGEPIERGADRGARQRRADRRPQGGGRERLVRRAALGHRGRLQGLRREPRRRGAPRADHRRGRGDRGARRWEGAADARRLRDRAGRRRGQAARAADARPRQAGRAVRRQLPADRLRALEPRQRRLPPDRRPHAVQEPLARPPHLDHLAAVAAARQLRRAGAGADAPRAALVRGLGRRHLPEPQPALRRAARHRDRVRRRPHLPHGPAADGRPAHRERRRA